MSCVTKLFLQVPTTDVLITDEPITNVIVHYKDDNFSINWTTFTTPTSAVYIVVVESGLTYEEDVARLKGTNITLTCTLCVL